MEFVMLFFSAIIIVCIVGNKLSARIGVPSLLIFLALGMICGSDGILKIPFDNYQLSEQVCTVCLIFIMFCGGFSVIPSGAGPCRREADPHMEQKNLASLRFLGCLMDIPL